MLHFSVTVRQTNGKLFQHKDGGGVGPFQFQKNLGYEATMAIESWCKQYTKDFEAITGSNNINVEVSEFDSISRTYPSLYSYYGKEERFVKH
jgi:hypothetical protein